MPAVSEPSGVEAGFFGTFCTGSALLAAPALSLLRESSLASPALPRGWAFLRLQEGHVLEAMQYLTLSQPC